MGPTVRWSRCVVIAVASAMSALGSGGCKSSPEASAPAAPLPTYDEIAKAHNARVARLGRVWSLATVSMTWTEESGRKRWEQGNGHLQYEAPMNTALSIGKLGETLFWVGTDDEQYWIIDLQKERRAYIGSHELLTRERVAELGLAVAPAQLPMLLGLRPLPVTFARGAPRPTVRAGSGGAVVVSVPDDGRTLAYTFDTRRLMPRQIRVLDSAGRVLLTSDLRDDDHVAIAGQDAFQPMMATLIDIRDEIDGASIKLTLSQMSDRRINPVNFDLAKLVETLGVTEFIDLDAPTQDEVKAQEQRQDL